MKRFSEIRDIQPTSLSKADFSELLDIVADKRDSVDWDVEINIKKDSVTYPFDLIDNMNVRGGSMDFDEINIRSNSNISDRSIDRYIGIKLGKKSAHYYIKSENEVWFFGKIYQIDKCFRTKRP